MKAKRIAFSKVKVGDIVSFAGELAEVTGITTFNGSRALVFGHYGIVWQGQKTAKVITDYGYFCKVCGVLNDSQVDQNLIGEETIWGAFEEYYYPFCKVCNKQVKEG